MKNASNALKVFLTAIVLILPIGIGALIGVLTSYQGEEETPTSTEAEAKILSLSDAEIAFNIGSNRMLTASLEEESESYIFQWNTSDKNIVSVKKDAEADNSCQLTAVGKGKATVTVSIIDITKFKIIESVDCEVNVSDDQIDFGMDELIISLDGGNQATIKATAPDGGEISWTSEDESIATVSNGVIVANKAGFVNIVAKSGDVESKLPVKVYNSYFALEDMKLVTVGSDGTIEADGNAYSNVTWSSSDDRIATVNNNGVVTGRQIGMATITATSEIDELISTCVVIVEDNTTQSVVLTEGNKSNAAKHPGKWYFLTESEQVTVSSTPCIEKGVISADITGIGESGSNFFYLRYQPDDIGDIIYKNTLYIYSDTDEVVIQANGSDYTLSKGLNRIEMEYISCETKDGNPYQIKWKGKGMFYVIPEFEEVSRIEKIILSDEMVTLNTNDNTSYTVTASVPTRTNPTIQWTSSNENVAVVSNGAITAVGEGSTILTITSDELIAKCLVRVEGDTPIEGEGLTAGNKSVTLENPGQWVYLKDGKSAFYYDPIIEADGTIHLGISEIDSANRKYVYLRYQPEKQGTYKATITIEYAGEDGANVDIAGGDVKATANTLKNGTNTIEFTFTSDDATPFQFKIYGDGDYQINVTFTEE